MVFQESCAESKVTIFHLGGGLNSVEELQDTIMYQGSPQGVTEKWPFGAGSPGTESSSRCRQEAPGWWLSDETETSRARQEVSPEETACLSMQVSRHLGAVSGCDLVVEDRVPN